MNEEVFPEGSLPKQIKRMTPSVSTKHRLYARSGNMCAFPDCGQILFEDGSDAAVVNICHIEAAEKGGERFNPSMTNAARAAFENLVLLCPNCHAKTDDVSVYTVERMRAMKQQHEDLVQERVSKKLMRNTTLLAEIVNLISELPISEEPHTISMPPHIETKISYNNVIRHKRIIEERAPYQFLLDNVYQQMDQFFPGKKHKMLLSVRSIYLSAIAEKTIESIRKESDALIDHVIATLVEKLHQSQNYKKSSLEEEDFAIEMIVIDAFLRCKVLEEPK